MSSRRSRRTTYKDWLDDDKLTLLTGWARSGLSNEQIAKNIGIAEGTYYRWMEKHSEIREAIKKGKEVSDFEVENALYESAKGYYYREEVTTPMGEVVEVRRYSKGHVGAQIFWLKNRKNLEWSNKDAVETKKLETEIKHKEAQIEFLKKKIAEITGEGFDTSLMESLIGNGVEFFENN